MATKQILGSDKERIRLEEEGLCEDDFKPISVNPDDQVECPELLKSQGESCWDSKQLVTLADLGNWTGEQNKMDKYQLSCFILDYCRRSIPRTSRKQR